MVFEDTVLFKQLQVLLPQVGIQCMWSGLDVLQSPLFSFLFPGLAVVVTFEQYLLAFLDVGLQYLQDGGVFLVTFVHQSFHCLAELTELLSHDGVHHNHGAGAVHAGAYSPNLELITGEGKR